MRPFFRYYGSKWQMAKYIGRPRRDLVIEPFAGSACYSLYWNCRNVKLYDIEIDIVELWDYLINCSANDINGLPDWIDSVSEVLELPPVEQTLITRWLSFGTTVKLQEDSSIENYKKYVSYVRDGGEWPYKCEDRSMGLCAHWSPAIKRRILQQKDLIKDWTVDLRDYRNIPNECAHWHIDPPYQSQMKAYNKDHTIDYQHLAVWINDRQGSADVCEQEGADWLEFKPVKRNSNAKRNKYTEMIWRNERTELF